MLRQKPVSLRTALQDCSSSVTQLCDAAPKAVLHAAEIQRIAKLCKRLQPLLEELAETTAADKQQQGVQLLQVTCLRLGSSVQRLVAGTLVSAHNGVVTNHC
jgi:hypothetical protein